MFTDPRCTWVPGAALRPEFYLSRIAILTAIERIEHDLLGDFAVPAAACYGVHTLRALENFSISGIPISAYPNLINALANVKEAALANYEFGLFSASPKMSAIVQACKQVRSGVAPEHFVVDVIQGSAGTSTNMNGQRKRVFRT